MIVITVKDTASVGGLRMARLLGNTNALNHAAALGALPVVQRNFAVMARINRNPFGVRGGFWNRMVGGTRVQPGSNQIKMPREVGLRRYGGTVVPKKAKHLAIPLRAEAYGKSPRQFPNIRFAQIGGKLFAFTTELQASRDKKGKRKLGGYKGREFEAFLPASQRGRRRITLLYLLAKSATIVGNTAVLPTDAELAAGATRGVEAHLRREMKGGPA